MTFASNKNELVRIRVDGGKRSKGVGIRLSSFFLLSLLGLATSCVAPHATPTRLPVQPAVVQSSMRYRKEYVFAVGDQLEVVVRKVAEVSRTVTIRPDGFISLPIVNEVQAAGCTAPELNQKLTKLLAARLLNPEVTVIATQVRQAVVYVAGDVANPTAVPVRNAVNAMQAITLAGGLKRTASADNITIVRLTPDGILQAIPVSVAVKGQPGPYMALATTQLVADDIVFVPENKRSEVARFLDDIVNRPLIVVNSIVGTYVNFRLVSAIVGG